MNHHSVLLTIFLVTTTCGLAPEASAEYVPIDNFEALSLGPINDQNGWSAQSGTEVTIDPVDESNQVLAVNSANTVAYHGLDLPADAKRMVFLRFRFDNQLNASFGLSHVSRPSEQSDFGPELRVTAPAADLRVGMGTAADTVAKLESQEWYNLWVLVNNPDDTIQLWLNTGATDTASESDKLSNTLSEEVFDFRTGSGIDLINFYIKNGSGGMDPFGPLYFDDIYLESTEMLNLNNPLALACNPNNQGDFDGNGIVAFADFLVLSTNFGSEVPNHTFGDFDCNGTVEFADFLGLSANFGKTIASSSAPVPEPTWPAPFGFVFLVGTLLHHHRKAGGRKEKQV